jgi:superfamily II DNA or RNA helicase
MNTSPAAAGLKITLGRDLTVSGLDPRLHRELIDQLQFANPKWLENQRLGRWNGSVPKTLRFYRKVGTTGLQVPRGYIRRLLLICKEGSLPYQLDDRRRTLPDVELKFKGRLKLFQQRAVDEMLKKEFGTLSAPPGAGKTVMALFMVARRRQPTLILVHTKELAFQWIDRIGTFTDIPTEAVGLFGAGRKRMGQQITVGLVQSIYRHANEIAPRTGFLIVDECHRTPSRTFTEAVSRFDARYMLGLSATPWRRDGLSRLIFWYLGDIHHQVDKARLVRQGHILNAEVISRTTQFVPYHDPVSEYSRMLSELTTDDARNRMIAADVALEARQARGICLVLSDRKHHCQILQALLHYKYGIAAALLTGDVSLPQRQEIIQRAAQNQIKVLVATGQLVGEGLDCPNLTTLFLATPIRFSGRVLQYLGRILRPASGKRTAKVYDYVDVHVAPLVAAAKARARLYRPL